MTSAAPPVIEVRGARLVRDDGQVVVDEVELEVARGDFLAVVGPDGAGKSALLRAVVSLVPPRVGLCVTRGRAGYVPQGAARDLARAQTVREVVALGLLGAGAGETGAAARRALQACGLSEAAELVARDLDDAERTRVAIARALAGDPIVLALDDPTGGLDEEGAQEVSDLLRTLHAGGLTVIVASRGVEPLARAANRVAFLRGGRLVVGPAADMLVPERLAALYEPPSAPASTTAGDDDVQELPIPSRDASPEERRAAARVRREAARAKREAARSGRAGAVEPGGARPDGARPGSARRGAQAGAPTGVAAATPAPTGPASLTGAPAWLWPLVILALLGGLIAAVRRGRDEHRAHAATIAALGSERAGRAADARAAQERELDALETASHLRADLEATRLDREAIVAAREELAARAEQLGAQLEGAEANRAALSAELQRTNAELAAARLEVTDGAAALDEAARARRVLEQEKAGLRRALDAAASTAAVLSEQVAARARERDEAVALASTAAVLSEQVAARARERDEALARATALEGERDAARAQAATAAGAGDALRARLAAADEALALARPTRTPLQVDAAQVTSSVNMVVRVEDGRVLGPAVQAALAGSAAVGLALRLSDPAAAGRLRLRAEAQGEAPSALVRDQAQVDPAGGEHVRFWLGRTTAARCARGFARDGFVLVLALDADPARPDEVLQVLQLELIVAPLSPEAARYLRALDRGED